MRGIIDYSEEKCCLLLTDNSSLGVATVVAAESSKSL